MYDLQKWKFKWTANIFLPVLIFSTNEINRLVKNDKGKLVKIPGFGGINEGFMVKTCQNPNLHHIHDNTRCPNCKHIFPKNAAAVFHKSKNYRLTNYDSFSMITRHEVNGPVVQSVSTPACHAGGRRFESVRGRQKNTTRRVVFFYDLTDSKIKSNSPFGVAKRRGDPKSDP